MSKSKFVKNNIIFISGTLIGGFLGYLFNFVVSRQISVAQYGELQSLTSAFIIFGVFNSALSFFTIRHTSVFAVHKDFAANRDFSNYLRSKVSAWAALMLLALLIFSPLLASFLHFSSYLGFFVISLSTFLSTVTVVYAETLRGWEKFFLLVLVGLAAAFMKFLAGSVFAYISHKTSIIAFSFLLSALVSWYLAKLWSKEKIDGEEHQETEGSWRNKYFSEANIKKTAFKIFFFSLALILVSNIDVLLVKYFASPDAAGYYGAFALLGKIVLWLTLPVVGVILPAACADGHSGKRPGKNDLLKTYGLMTVIALGLILLYYFIPDFIINFFFGKKYVLDTHFLWLFGIMSYLLSILTLESNLAFAKRDFRVIYILTVTLIIMISGLAKFHANLSEIVLSFSASFLFGYVFITILNLTHERKVAQRI